MNNEQQQRLKADKEVASRIEDLVAADADGTAITLINVALAIFADRYPAKLDITAKGRIKENYPDATDALIAERAMSKDGVVMALTTAIQMARVAIDYSPLSNIKQESDTDFSLPPHVNESVGAIIASAFETMQATGMSTFGVATTMILSAVVEANNKGDVGLKLARSLLDALELVLEKTAKPSQKDIEEEAIKVLRERMDISRSEAQKYIAVSKNRAKRVKS